MSDIDDQRRHKAFLHCLRADFMGALWLTLAVGGVLVVVAWITH